MNNRNLNILICVYALFSVLVTIVIVSEARTIIGTNIHSDKVIAQIGFKDMNESVWQAKLDYALGLATVILYENHKYAISKINSSDTDIFINPYNSLIYKKTMLNDTYNLSLQYELTSANIARARILEAKNLALLNGESEVDITNIEAQAQYRSDLLNQTLINQTLDLSNHYNQSIQELNNVTITTGINYTIVVKDQVSGLNVLLTYKYGLLTGATRP